LRVLFVYPDISGAERYGAPKYYSGIGSLSAVLKAAGHETMLVYLQTVVSLEEFVERVDDSRPDLVAFSSTTNQFPYAERYARHLKAARPDMILVCGGVHATLVPEQVIATEAFDAICVGEGEYCLRDLAGRLSRGEDYVDVANLWLRRDDAVIRNPMRPLVADLDALPYVDREIFDYDDVLAANDSWVDIVAGRGCPYNCSYCCNPGLKARYKGLGRYVRMRSVEHVIGEIRELESRYPIKTINFQDDTFTLDKDWTLSWCRAYGSDFEYPFWINTRVERILDEEIVSALADAHCAGIRVGVENGNEALRASVLKRTMSNDDIIEAFRLVRQYGIKAYTCNMIGIPGETPSSVQATIDLNRQLKPDSFQFSVFYPYPMTELHETCVSQALIRPDAKLDGYYGKESVLDLPTLSADELAQGYERFSALADELALERSSPWKHKVYRLLLKLYRDDGPRLQRHLSRLRRLRRAARRGGPSEAAAQ